jgi:hypothetical protein
VDISTLPERFARFYEKCGPIIVRNAGAPHYVSEFWVRDGVLFARDGDYRFPVDPEPIDRELASEGF